MWNFSSSETYYTPFKYNNLCYLKDDLAVSDDSDDEKPNTSQDDVMAF